MNQHQERVLHEVAVRDIRFIRLWLADVADVLKSLTIDSGELEDVFTEDIGFDGSSVEGLTRAHEPNMLLVPDTQTFQLLPWRNAKESVARMFCDVYTPDGQEVHSDPRVVLQHAVERVRTLGFTVMVYPEIGLYLLRQSVSIDCMIPTDSAGYFDHAARGDSNDFRRQATKMFEDMDIAVEFSHHEGSPSQNGIDLRVVDAMTVADNVTTAHTVIEEVALRESLVATFIPKPFIDHSGSGAYTHISLFEGDENAFYEPPGEYQLSLTGKRFIAGLLEHAYELMAVANQHVNSYKHSWGEVEVPVYVCWGHNNSSVLVRVPLYKSSKRHAARIEYRALGPAANPYLVFVVLVMTGLDRIGKKCEFMPGTEGSVRDLTGRERRVFSIHALPSSLSSAVQGTRESNPVAETLGEKVFTYVTHGKEKE